MTQTIDPAAEKSRIEAIIKNSITWAQTKDKELLFGSFVDDSTLFYFSPDNAGTISGIDAFRQLVDDLFMNPAFKAIKAEFKDLRITLARTGDCAWWSCYLDDFNEWNGNPANWENVRWTGVLEKRGGAWKIVQMHFSHATEDFAVGE